MLANCHEDHGVAIFSLAGNLDRRAAPFLYEIVAQLCDCQRVIFDLSSVRSADPAALRPLLNALRQLRASGGRAVVCAARPGVTRALRLARFDWVAVVASSVREAFSYFSEMAEAYDYLANLPA